MMRWELEKPPLPTNPLQSEKSAELEKFAELMAAHEAEIARAFAMPRWLTDDPLVALMPKSAWGPELEARVEAELQALGISSWKALGVSSESFEEMCRKL